MTSFPIFAVMRSVLLGFILCLLLTACGGQPGGASVSPGCDYARYFELTEDAVITISPYDGTRDTLRLERPLDRLVCMSTSYIGYLDGIGCDSVVVGVSGIGYISQPALRARYEATRQGRPGRELYDVGYDADPDYERILALGPDLLIAYSISSAEPPYLRRLKELGIPVLLLSEHLEDHPLARSEYVRLFGALTGRRQQADSLFAAIRTRYESLCVQASDPVPVLLNIPYADQWFIPGEDNYMAQLVRDAGGRVLGAEPGNASRTVSLEEAYLLAAQARAWLNPGWCRTRNQLISQLPSFSRFDIPRIYNNIRRTTPEGGNDFWERGALRADEILADLVRILDEEKASPSEEELAWFIRVE